MIPEKFSTFSPTDSKNLTPRVRVKITPTPYTVKSLGLYIERYRIKNQSLPDFTSLSNLELLDKGVSPLCGFYADTGAPLGLAITDRFAIHYHGNFYTSLNSPVSMITFKAIGLGHLRVKIDGSYIIGGASSYKSLSDIKYTNEATYIVGLDTWVDFEVDYYVDKGESGFVLLWKDNVEDTYVPVSAGVTNIYKSFLSSTEITGILNVNLDISQRSVDTADFTLAFK